MTADIYRNQALHPSFPPSYILSRLTTRRKKILHIRRQIPNQVL